MIGCVQSVEFGSDEMSRAGYGWVQSVGLASVVWSLVMVGCVQSVLLRCVQVTLDGFSYFVLCYEKRR